MEGIVNASQLIVKEEEEEKVMNIDNKECKVKQRLLGENRDGSHKDNFGKSLKTLSAAKSQSCTVTRRSAEFRHPARMTQDSSFYIGENDCSI